MKIGYLLSTQLPYNKLICGDAGPAVAEEYGWDTCFISSDLQASFDVLVIDNRHHNQEELHQVSNLIRHSSSTRFVLRVVDPCIFHVHDGWYKLCHEFIDHPNVHYISPYQPTGLLSYWLSHATKSQFIYAPFTYDKGCELNISHASRRKRMIVSGNLRQDLYPLRFVFQKATRLPGGSRFFKIDRLVHPRYAEKAGSHSHNIIGKEYITFLSAYSLAFVDSSVYRIELLKYREIAYAGCAPLGDLPWSLFTCPENAIYKYQSMKDLFRVRTIVEDSSASEAAALSYRHFMSTMRSRPFWISKVYSAISNLF